METLELRSTRISGASRIGARLSRALAYLGLALGIVEIIAPQAIATLAGLDPDAVGIAPVIRLFGLRGVGLGIAILASPRGALPLWLRLAGDAIDFAFLAMAGLAMVDPGRYAIALNVVMAMAALDAIAALRARASTVRFAMTVACPAEEVYWFYRDVAQLPPRSKITTDRPGRRIAWEPAFDAHHPTHGAVTFSSQGELTRVCFEMRVAKETFPEQRIAQLVLEPRIRRELRKLEELLAAGV